jgi:tetratricopeptide (TPR) repeat protein
MLGYPDRARRKLRQAIELARAGDAYIHALGISMAADQYYWLGERETALELADEGIAIARELGFAQVLAMGTQTRGAALGGSRGLEELQQGIAQFEAVGVELGKALALTQATAASLELGRTEDARTALQAAVTRVPTVPTLDAELQRLMGEILLREGAAEEAERCFRRALEIARDQRFKWNELRVATSLARLLRDQGRHDEARALLEPVYAWFTEGFDTADLKDAKALLDEL